MSQLITHAPPVSRTRTQTGAHGDRHPTVTAKRTSGRYAGRSADFGGGVRGGALMRAGWCVGRGSRKGSGCRAAVFLTVRATVEGNTPPRGPPIPALLA